MEPFNNVTQMDSRERIRNLYFQSGDVIAGRYEFVRVLGRGGMGVVCLCKDMKDEGRTVALKTVPDILRSDEASVAALREEFRGMLSLTHDGIVTVRSLEDDEFRFYIVMDYAEGETLENYLKKHPKPGLAITWEVVHRLAKALDYAHEKNMVHRDVKPANVMVQIDDETVKSLKLLDFGLGLRIKESVSHISGILTGGTPAYKSPEQWRPDLYGFKLTAKADQYALALLAYEMLDGHYPFYSFDVTTFSNAVLNVQPPKINDVSDVVNDALLKALAKKPEDRFDSCMAFAEALKGAQPATSYSSNADVLKRQQSIVTPTPLPQPPVVTPTLQSSTEPVKRKGNLTLKLAEGVNLEMIWIPAGMFMMGSNEGSKDEKPIHRVKISKDFWIGETVVTRIQYEAIMGAKWSWFKKNGNLPMVKVSWNDAMAFCKRVAEQERVAGRVPVGYEYSLPTEAQWEYAARGGDKSKGYTYSGSNNFGTVGWSWNNSGNSLECVKQKIPNELGLYDMSGNVWEWCKDFCDTTIWGYVKTDTYMDDVIDPCCDKGSKCVIRGGSYLSSTSKCRLTYRYSSDPSQCGNGIGFRLALVAVQ